ncbi:MAG: sigma-70 family RNA polymerase sigma factor [Planctomycetota bacterium]
MASASWKRREGPDVTGETDEALIERARAGDDEAFGQLFERHAPLLRAKVRRKLPTALRRKVSESDVIQAAYLGVHKNIERFDDRGEGSFERWLHGIVDNKIRDILRHHFGAQKRGAQREVSRAARAETRQFVAREATPSAHAMAGELEGRVRQAMTQLSTDHRLVLRLVQEEGLTLAEAAEKIGRSSEAVRKLYARAISRLSDLVHGSES